MARKFIDCREYPSEIHCTVAISADSERELLDVAVQHAVAIHGHSDSPELRAMLKTLIKEEALAGVPSEDTRNFEYPD